MLLCVIDTKEGRKVATLDIPSAFMKCDMDELAHVKFEGMMAEMLTKINPNHYLKCIQGQRGVERLSTT